MELTEEQKIIFDKYVSGENIFITGPGGTGKTALIREIYQHAINQEKRIQVCALTGCAAVLLQCKAKTIHSWAGIGQASGESQKIIERVIKNKYKRQNWIDTELLIVDEVSMLSKRLFQVLNNIGQRARKRIGIPFGGIQVIFSGDFYQLPPVGDKEDIETSQFCFESEIWSSLFPKSNQISLKKIFRQSDPKYANILNQIREGILKRKSYDILRHQVGKKLEEDIDIQPTKLYPRRYSVEAINSGEMKKLNTEERIYDMRRETNITATKTKYTNEEIEYEISYLTASMPCERSVKLRLGAQVMCVVNMEICGYVLCNGSQGIITDFTEQKLPVVKFHGIPRPITIGYHSWVSESISCVGVSQIPLILAWALTIHKAQGATLELAEIDVGNNIFECGQTYVALSRVKSLDGLYLTAFDYTKILTNKKVKEYYHNLNSGLNDDKNNKSVIKTDKDESSKKEISSESLQEMQSPTIMDKWLNVK
jgi:ATP-dependent DNA helicase PIF1